MRKLLLLGLLVFLKADLRSEPQWRGETIAEDPGIRSFESGYINPNESETHVWQPVVQSLSGAYLGVGSFRTLNLAAQGNFSTVFQVDFDEVTRDFNRAHLAILKNAPDRRTYLSWLFGLDLTPEALRQLDSPDWQKSLTLMMGKTASAKLLKELGKEFPNVSAEPERFRSRKKKESFDLEFSAEEKAALESTVKKFLTPASLATYRNAFSRDDQWSNTLWGSDLLFQRIQALARKGEIIPIQGSLSGSQTMRSIARLCEQKKVAVSAIDLSNALDHIVENALNSKTPQAVVLALKQFTENLKSFPYAKDSTLLLTITGIRPRDAHDEQSRDVWSYVAASPKTWIEYLESNPVTDWASWEKFPVKMGEALRLKRFRKHGHGLYVSPEFVGKVKDCTLGLSFLAAEK